VKEHVCKKVTCVNLVKYDLSFVDEIKISGFKPLPEGLAHSRNHETIPWNAKIKFQKGHRG
jgi:hypothetical protein